MDEVGWHGRLDLVYDYCQNGTVLRGNYQQAPLKVQRPFYPEGSQVCHSVILHTAGGVVEGDRLTSHIHLQAQAQVLITTATASKIYLSNGKESEQNIQIKVDDNACLEWLPQETIVFNGANYRQNLQVELAANATWLGWEITRFGRTARGEKFVQGKWRSYTEVWRENVPLWIDRQYLPGSEEVFHSPHCLAGQPIVGTLVWLGSPVSTEIIKQARMGEIISDAEIGVTRLEHGFLCRYRGCSTSEVRNWFTSVWQLMRMSFLQRGNCLPRVW
jgi:urease accessory protein